MFEPDQNLFAANAAALRGRYPQWAEQVLSQSHPSYALVRASDHRFCLAVSDASGVEVILETLGGADGMYSLPVDDGRERLFVLLGLGLGGGLLQARAQFPNSRFLIVEPDAHVFQWALRCNDFAGSLQDSAVEFLIGVSLGSLKMAVVECLRRSDFSNYLPRAESLTHPRLTKLNSDYFSKAAVVFQQAVQHYWDINVGNSTDDTLMGQESYFENLKLLPRVTAFDPYVNRYAGITGMIVSSGPSLNGSIEALKKIQDRVLIICADSALRILLGHGICPFGVATMERDHAIPKLFQGFEIPRDVVYFTTPFIQPELFASYPGPLVPFQPHLKQFDWLPDLLPKVNTGACCAHLAYQVLCRLGCREIALIGQDLAFDRFSGESYVNGAFKSSSDFEQQLPRVTLPDNRGTTIESHYWWMLYRDIFEAMIREQDVKVLNVIPKDYGARIAGAELVAPADFFESLERETSGPGRFDALPGQTWMANRLPDFFNDMQVRVQALLAGLSAMDAGLVSLSACADAAAYFQNLLTVRENVDVLALRLFDEIWRPQSKRFDAAAQSLWSVQEFRDSRDAYLAQARQTLKRLVAIWEPMGRNARDSSNSVDLSNVVRDNFVRGAL